MRDSDREMIVNNIKKFRLIRNLTQQRLSEMVNMDTQYYAQIERGERNLTLDKLIDICRALNVHIEQVIEIDVAENEQSQEIIDRIHSMLSHYTDIQLLVIEKVIADIETLF